MKTYTQTDKLGRELAVDDCVVFNSYYGGLVIGRVVKLNRTRVRVQRVTELRLFERSEDIQPYDMIKLDSRDVEFYLLKQK